MKKKIILVTLCCMLLGMSACGDDGKTESFSGEPISATESSNEGQNQNVNDNQGQAGSENGNQTTGGNSSELKVQEFFTDGVEASDFEHDYDAELQTGIDAIAASSASVQEELTAVTRIAEQFDKLAQAANTQFEMNVSAQWFYVIWDKELNSLWSRISSQADAQTKERLLSEQRNWVSMKEEVTLEYVGNSEEGGSMYPMQQYGFWEDITRNRVYILANEFSKIKGESFVMPERTSKYGVYVDNQGTGSVYGSLITRKGWEGDDEAVISIYRVGVFEGTFTEKGNGKYEFSTYDKEIQGTIQMNGWEGASFEVTRAQNDGIISVGDVFEFNFAY